MGEAFAIERRVPMPDRCCGKGESKYPLRQLKVGDSFLLRQRQVRGGPHFIYELARRIDIKVATRKVKDGWRVWRVK